MSESQDTPKAKRRAIDKIDDFLLNGLLVALLAGTIGVIGLDAQSLLTASKGPDWIPHQDRTEPMPMRIAMPDDHVRPYLPRTRPMLSRNARVRMPGFAEPVPSKMLAEPMIFRMGSNGRVSAVGRIVTGSAQAFADFLAVQAPRDNPKAVRVIYLHSPGGVVSQALRMSRLIRDRELATHVPRNGYCASSCPLVLAGGTKRSAGKPSWIGVHQIFAGRTAFGTIQQGMHQAQLISARTQSHLVTMGIDPKAWLHAMVTPKDKLYLFTRKQLVEYRWISPPAPKKRKRG